MSVTTINQRGFGVTFRTDRWWVGPLLIVFGLSAFIVYSSWGAWQGAYYWWNAGAHGFGGYLSPFYSPLFFVAPEMPGSAPLDHAWFGTTPSWWPAFLPPSPAFLVFILPGLFRFTCYYYRKAYYRAFAATPPACAVSPIPQKNYKGETGLLIFQNLHRFALYFALCFIVILSYDAVMAFFQGGKLGIGIGSIILLINPILIACYTLGCHSFRHLVGGRLDCLSCSKARYQVWKKVSWLNARHEFFAWASLIWIGFTDFYVRMVSMGVWKDWNTW